MSYRDSDLIDDAMLELIEPSDCNDLLENDQVHYLDGHLINAYEVFVNTEPFLRCVTSSHSVEVSQPVANT